MPILFPANRIENGKFEFDGREYIFPINEKATNCHLHGFLHNAEFHVIEKEECFIRCRYDSDELYSFFPHRFCVEIFYSLSDMGLMQETSVYNLSETDMPLFLGFHTTFNIPFADGSREENVSIFAEVGDEVERDMSTYLPTGRILTCDEISRQFSNGKFFPANNKISRHYKSDKNGRIELLDMEKQMKIVYENDEKFGWRLFYNGSGEGFICLEPQTCMVNCQNLQIDGENTGFDFIEPDNFKKYISKIYIEKF